MSGTHLHLNQVTQEGPRLSMSTTVFLTHLANNWLSIGVGMHPEVGIKVTAQVLEIKKSNKEAIQPYSVFQASTRLIDPIMRLL